MSSLTFSSTATAIALLSFTNYSFAQSIDGIWSTKSGCDWLESQANLEDSTAYSLGYLNSKGVNGLNWGCAFNEIDTTVNGVITAESSCWLETEFWHQNIVIKKDPAGWIVTLHEDTQEKVYLVFDTKCVASN